MKNLYPALLVVLLAGGVYLAAAAASKKPSDLVEVKSINPDIQVSLPYASENNFCRQALYAVERCFLRREVAEQLSLVQQDLAREGYGLKLWDGYRPRSVQYKMWSILPHTPYVADPRRGSRHNRGAAVDLTLVDHSGAEVAMPTAYDVFNVKAHAYYKKLPPEVIANRTRLQQAMVRHGFRVMATEWWHFDYIGWEKFPLLDTSLEQLAAEADAEKKNGPEEPKPAPDQLP